MNKILLDTNAYSNLLSGNESVFTAISNAEVIYITPVVIGELLFGFKNGKKYKWNKEILNKFLSKPGIQILKVSIETSEIFSDIMASLKKSGNPIPINDIWIASQAIETGSVLITFDKHFQKILSLRIWEEVKL